MSLLSRSPANRLVLALGVWLLLVSGCGDRPASVSRDEALTEVMVGARDEGEPVRFRALTDFTWDRVFVFRRYAGGQMINEVVGHDVVREDFNADESIAVLFFEGDEVVRAVTVGVLVDTGDDGYVTASAEAWLVPQFPPGDRRVPPICVLDELPAGATHPAC